MNIDEKLKMAEEIISGHVQNMVVATVAAGLEPVLVFAALQKISFELMIGSGNVDGVPLESTRVVCQDFSSTILRKKFDSYAAKCAEKKADN